MSEVLTLPPGITGAPALAAGALASNLMLVEGLAPSKATYFLPDPASRPRVGIEITQIYMPIAIATVNPSGQPQPTKANLLLTLQDQVIRWAWSGTIDLLAAPNLVNTSANMTIIDDLVNPVHIGEVDQPTLVATMSFDEATTGSNLWVGTQIADPESLSRIAIPGAIYYRTQT